MSDKEQSVKRMLNEKLKPEEGNGLILERLELGASDRDWGVVEDYLIRINPWDEVEKKEVVANIFEYLDNEGLRIRPVFDWGWFLMSLGVLLATLSIFVLKAVK